jgi:hypothetical protein
MVLCYVGMVWHGVVWAPLPPPTLLHLPAFQENVVLVGIELLNGVKCEHWRLTSATLQCFDLWTTGVAPGSATAPVASSGGGGFVLLMPR